MEHTRAYTGRARGRGRGFDTRRSESGDPGHGTSHTSQVRRDSHDGGRGRGGFSRGQGGNYGGNGYASRGGGRYGENRGGYRGSGRGNRGHSQFEDRILIPNEKVTIDARLQDDSQETVVNLLKDVKGDKVEHDDHAFRPDFGTLGKPVTLRANYFPMTFPERTLFEYKVEISPKPKSSSHKKMLFRSVEKTTDWQQRELLNTVAHDYSQTLISLRELPQPLVIKMHCEEDNNTLDERNRGSAQGQMTGSDYSFTFEYVDKIEMKDLANYLSGNPEHRKYDNILHIITALNIILGSYPSSSEGGGIRLGRRHFFSTAFAPVNLGFGLEGLKGFFSSVRTTHRQLMVNVNVSNSAFYKSGNLADWMKKYPYMRLRDFVAKGLKLKLSNHPKDQFKKISTSVKTLLKLNANEYRIEWRKQEISITEYYYREYKFKLQNPQLRLVITHASKDPIPPEICDILPGQAFLGGTLPKESSEAMLRFASKPPEVNRNAITNQGLSSLGYLDTAPLLNPFEISIGKEMAIVPGRILDAPGVRYGRGDPLKVDKEKGSWNMRGVEFTKGATLENWAVLLLRDGNGKSYSEFADCNDPRLRKAVQGFSAMCKKSGMTVRGQPEYVDVQFPEVDDPSRTMAIEAVHAELMKLISKGKPNLVLVVLPDGNETIYAGLKYLCDVCLDVATVCVLANKLSKVQGQLQYFANVALKVNMKLGGENHGVEAVDMKWLREMPTMLIGMDVTHPSKNSVKYTPSIAAVVANVDDQFAQYPACMTIQKSREEMVLDVKEMVRSRLQLYLDRNDVLPKRIIVFRDGVSEGQFSIVKKKELYEIKDAFKLFDEPTESYEPKITIVICGKRHQTRFYSTDAADADSKGNCKPGTVVDRGVTSIYNFDFFLQPHASLQGSARPTHYYVVHDELELNADVLQPLANSVSYTFSRATKAVSLIPPAYYADLACERGRCYLHEMLTGKSAVKGTAKEVMEKAEEAWAGGVSGEKLRDTMFYL